MGAVGWNDQGNDEIVNGVVENGGANPSSALFDYSGQSAAEATVPNAAVSDSYFLIYNKNNTANFCAANDRVLDQSGHRDQRPHRGG